MFDVEVTSLKKTPWLLAMSLLMTSSAGLAKPLFHWSTMQSKAALGLHGSTSLNLADEAQTFLGEDPAAQLQKWLQAQPQLMPGGCNPALESSFKHQESSHFTFSILCQDLPLLGSTWHVHLYKSKLVMVTQSNIWEQDDVALRFIKPSPHDRILKITKGLNPASMNPAREEEVLSGQTGLPEIRLVDDASGEVLKRHVRQFDAVSFAGYAVNQLDSHLESFTLETQGNGFLDSLSGFRVFGDKKDSSRLPIDPLRSIVPYEGVISPDVAEYRSYFDQLQAFYTLDRATRWFKDNFGYQLEGRIDVFTDSLQDHTPNNARYVPASGSNNPALVIGPGDSQTYRNLARDTDVIFHEFSHHILYRTMKVAYGETGMLHEGTADYFAYAINGDPYLGESVKIGSPYIRTAKLDAADRYDTRDESSDPHALGEYWSAFLWALREEAGGAVTDKLVFHAIDYLPPAAGLRDFFDALLSVDRDLYPDLHTTDEGLVGLHHCLILQHAIDRGFTASLENLNGQPCNLDLITLAAESRQIRESLDSDRDDKSDGVSEGEKNNLLKACGVVGKQASSNFFTVCWFLMPMVLVVFSRRRMALKIARDAKLLGDRKE